MEHRLATRHGSSLVADAFVPWLGMVRGRLLDISVDGAFFEGAVPDNVINDRISLMVAVPGEAGQVGPIVAYVVRRAATGVGVMFSEHHETTVGLVQRLLKISREAPVAPRGDIPWIGIGTGPGKSIPINAAK
jgi:hypothetical protein